MVKLTAMCELFSFLEDEREDVRLLAAQNTASLSASPEMKGYFKENNFEGVRLLKNRRKDSMMIAHEAIKALINLSSDDEILNVMDDDAFIFDMILTLVVPNSLLSDLCCMLLNNLTKNVNITKKLIPQTTHTKEAEQHDKAKIKTQYLDNLLEVFVRGESKKFNPNANFHFLSGVFANASITQSGANYFLGKSSVDGTLRLSRIIPYTEHPDLIRRGGAISTMKNCCFFHEAHEEMLISEELNLLPYILLPLCGSDEFSDEEMEGMPDELQFLEPTKQRENDPKLRLMLVETLLLLTSTRIGREYLRVKKVYPIIQKLHLFETDDQVKDTIERLVDMLIRDEAVLDSNNVVSSKKSKSRIQAVVDSDDEDEQEHMSRIEELI